MPDMNAYIAHLVRPFDAGWYRAVWVWYRAVRVWYIPFDFRNSPDLTLVKLVPLSVTSVSGIPKVGNLKCIFSTVTDEVAEVVMCTSIHFECVSISMRYILPRKGPA